MDDRCTKIFVPVEVGETIYELTDSYEFIKYKVTGIRIGENNTVGIKLKYKDEFGDLSKRVITEEELITRFFSKKTKDKIMKFKDENSIKLRSEKHNGK